uniref:Uncharacterized protein n=1 Tax=Cannabis sativa TaxID=3483 RepID=A0A803R0E7_CANSA
MAYSTEPNIFYCSYEHDATLTDEDHIASEDSFYSCPFFNSSDYHQDELLHALIPSSCREEAFSATNPWNENVETEEVYEGEQQPPNSCYGNWLSKYQSVFNGCWEENYGSVGNENDNGSENSEQANPNHQEQNNRHFTHQDEDGEYYNPWSDSWLEYGFENDCSNYGGEEDNAAYSSGLPEVGVCEGLFGYWPCLYRTT